MKAKEFDKFFRDKIDSMDGVPKSASWNKGATWDRLNEAMTRKPSGKWYKIAAASVALFFVKSQKIFAAASFTTKAVVVVSTVAVVSTTSVVVYNATTSNDNITQNVVAGDNRTNTTIAENKTEPVEESVVETPVEEKTTVTVDNSFKKETVKIPEQGNKTTVSQPEDRSVVVETPVINQQDAPADPVVENPRSQKREMSLEINDILFKKNSYEVNPKSMSELNYLLTVLRENANLKAVIMGYCDEKEKDGDHLQSQRATMVWKYLISQGIDKSRLNFGGYGISKKYSSKFEEGRELNRRVEVMLSE